MAVARERLGRGLSALLGDVDQTVARVGPALGDDPSAGADKAQKNGGPAGAMIVPIARVERNPDQPRKRFDETELEDLAASIRAKGVLQPILVRPIPGRDGHFQIVAGERRWRASQRAGLHEVPVVIRDLSDLEVLEISIIENVQRADLNPIEEARGYQALIDQFGHTQEAIAKVVGKSRSHVANALRLLALPSRVRDLVQDNRLTAGHARAIATAADVEALAEQIIAGGLNVREAEALAREEATANRPAGAPRPGRPPAKDPNTISLEKEVAGALGLEVDIRHKGEAGGEIRIRYIQLDQLEGICKRLRKGL